MKILNVNTPKWANQDKTCVELQVDVEGIGVIPFGAAPFDPEPHGRDLFARAVAGEFGPIAEYVEPTLTEEQIRASKIAEMARIEAELGMTRVMRESMLMTLPDCYQRTKIQEAEDRIAAIRATL